MRDGTMDKQEPGSIFAAVLDLIPFFGAAAWNLRVLVEAVLITLISFYVVRGINVPEAGLVGLSLASAAMVPRFNTIFAINRELIWAASGTGKSVNTRSVISGMGIFGGMFIGFLVMAMVTDEVALRDHFGFVLTVTGFEPGDTLSPERFELGHTVLIHNLFVLLTFAILSLLYRSLGTMIAVGWNASVWAITLVLFVRGGSGLDINQFLYATIVFVAIMPHLLIEAFGYVVGALCGVFLSRGITLYEFSDPRLHRVLMAVFVLAVVSVTLIISGGLIETNYAPRVLGLLN